MILQAIVTIIDTAGNMLFRGTDYDGDDYSGESKADMRQAAMDIVSSNIKKLFEAAELYQTVEVSPYLDMDFDTVSETEVTYNTGDREQGPYTASYEVEQTGGTSSGGIPGTDSNDEDITYELQDSSNSTSEYTLKKYDYAVNQLVSNTTKERGKIDYTTSRVSIVVSSYNIFEEDKVRAAGQLADMTWDEFKSANADNVEVQIPDNIYNLVSDATGFSTDNITIVGYRVPQFVDSVKNTQEALRIIYRLYLQYLYLHFSVLLYLRVQDRLKLLNRNLNSVQALPFIYFFFFSRKIRKQLMILILMINQIPERRLRNLLMKIRKLRHCCFVTG